MKAIPANLILEKNKVNTKSAWLILLEITLTDTPATVLRYVRNNENITYPSGPTGHEYTAFPFQLEPAKMSSKGEIPSYTLRVGNITRILQPYLQALDGGNGSTVKITVVNSELLSETYTELEVTCDVLACQSTAEWVVFTLGAPNPLRRRFPLDRYLALHCRFHYNLPSDNYPECGYVGKDIEGITLSSGNPVSIEITGHGFVTGDLITFIDITGTIELNGNSYIITKTNANNFTLDDTDGDDFTAYTSDGTAGFSTCKRTLADCRLRGNSVRFGGFPGMRSGSARIA